MPEHTASVVVRGQHGLAHDVVRRTLGVAGLATVELVAMERSPEAAVVVVLVNPTDDDWAQAEDLGGRVVLVSERRTDAVAAVDSLIRGAEAVIDADADLEALVEVVSTVAAGGSHLTSSQASEAIQRLRRTPLAPAGAPALTLRELDILASIDRGDVVKQTARELGISEKTVQNIQSRLFRKLGAKNRAQAMARAHELGYLTPIVRSVE